MKWFMCPGCSVHWSPQRRGTQAAPKDRCPECGTKGVRLNNAGRPHKDAGLKKKERKK